MSEYLQVWHARVPEHNVERLLELRPAAIAEARRRCPELVSPTSSGWKTARGSTYCGGADPTGRSG